ncbi:hypothetical protein MPH_01281 [Macrophomina phaseolina MS6]|uniref:Uncharacterized protein n=1 Tax=Macrophomina phaseolina (strain MS6) TaxID=1126212 RepID=K2SFQ9_MACPH|nr:hypothetical protein MPH_01281 [Macrophomina phaseolina MS6]
MAFGATWRCIVAVVVRRSSPFFFCLSRIFCLALLQLCYTARRNFSYGAMWGDGDVIAREGPLLWCGDLLLVVPGLRLYHQLAFRRRLLAWQWCHVPEIREVYSAYLLFGLPFLFFSFLVNGLLYSLVWSKCLHQKKIRWANLLLSDMRCLFCGSLLYHTCFFFLPFSLLLRVQLVLGGKGF